ncbi:ketopantoate reductase family protein [Roseomonas sp. USHLN139]|uniref:ketopantoate reductase family protein n=1 Tax=Roseomonas sp. USHLN139 TaxID=3081298 RepID=UPI003B0142D4
MARIAILGCGAMGSVYAGLFAAAGHEVLAFDAWPEHVAAMNRDGLRVEGASGDRVVRVSAATTTEGATPVDLVVLATKARDVATAARAIPPLLGPGSSVLTIQNGLGSSEALAAALPGAHVVAGIAGGFGASLKGPGHAHHNGMEKVRIGELAGPATDRLRAIAALWEAAGFRVAAEDDIARLTWEKLICNVTYSAVCALSGKTIGGVMADPDLWPVARAAGVEAWTVAKARGVPITVDDPVRHITSFGQAIPDARPSLLLDHLAQRKSEIDAINGSIPREAQKAGIAAPVNATLVGLVRAREAGFA